MDPQTLQARQHDALIDSIEAMLRPVVPLFLNFGVSYAELADMVRGVFVKAVADQLGREGRPASLARLSLMTGVNKSHVERLLSDRLAAVVRRREAEQHRLAIANALSLWHDDSRFSTLYGIPLDLAMSVDSSARKFSELAAIAAPGVDPEILADELVVSGCAAYSDIGTLRCLRRMFIPSGLDPLAISQIGYVTKTLTSTVIHNLTRDSSQPSYFERHVVSDSPVSELGLRKFLDYLEREGQAFLQKTDRWTNAEQQVEVDLAGKRIGLGLYVYEMDDSALMADRASVSA